MSLRQKSEAGSSSERGILGVGLESSFPVKHHSRGVVTSIALSGVVDAILEVSRQRKALLDQLRAALQSGNNAEALQLARELCGLSG